MNKTKTTNYSGISKFYFDKIISEIIFLGEINSSNKKILDFGCGEKRLETMLNKKIYNYDINPSYNEVDNLTSINFDIVVMNHVLMYLSRNQIEILFTKFISKNPNCEFLIGIGKQNYVSLIAKSITLNFKAHQGTISSYNEQLDAINNSMNIIKSKKNIFFMTDLFLCKF